MLISIQRYVVVRTPNGEKRVATTLCSWCTDDAVCSACHAKAEALRLRKKG